MMALLEDTDWNDESDHNCSNELLIIFEGLIVAVVVVTYVIDICVSICLSIPKDTQEVSTRAIPIEIESAIPLT